MLKTGSEVMQAGSQIAEQSARWAKPTEGSAEKMSKHALMKGSSSDVNRAVLAQNGKITGLLKILNCPGSIS